LLREKSYSRRIRRVKNPHNLNEQIMRGKDSGNFNLKGLKQASFIPDTFQK